MFSVLIFETLLCWVLEPLLAALLCLTASSHSPTHSQGLNLIREHGGDPGWRRRLMAGPCNPKPRELIAKVVAKFQKKGK